MGIELWGAKRAVTTLSSTAQTDPHLARLADGRVIAVWTDASTGDNRIVGRVFNADGTPSGDVQTYQASDGIGFSRAHVVGTDDGGWWIGSVAADAHYARFGPDGTTAGPDAIQPGTAQQSIEQFRVGTDVWFTNNDGSGAGNSLNFYRTSGGGQSFVNTQFTMQSDTGGTQDNPAGVQLSGGNVLLAWREGTEIEYRLFTPDAVPLTSDRLATTTGVKVFPDQNAAQAAIGKPHVTALGNGGALILWSSPTTGAPFPGNEVDVWGRIITPGGSAAGDPFLLNARIAGNQFNATAVPTNGGGLVLVYFSGPGASTGMANAPELRAQAYDVFGARSGTELVIASGAVLSGADSVSATALRDGRIQVAWVETGQAGSGETVVTRIIDPRDGAVAGTSGADALFGGRSADNIVAGDGPDTVYGLAGNDQIEGGRGADFLLGGLGDDEIYGGHQSDTLIGSYGDDLLDGGTGADDMRGGNGNDTYIVDAAGDTITETGGVTDIDEVRTSVSFSLFGNPLENLVFTGTGAFTGTGNSLDNRIEAAEGDDTLTGAGGNDHLIGGGGHDTLFGGADNDTLEGGSGNDRLDGGAGIDVMIGGAGNDTYVVDHALDAITETGGGTDTVEAGIGFSLLGVAIEALLLTGSGNIVGTGNSFANLVTGNAGNNILSGGVGNDTLRGQGGNDTLMGEAGNDTLEGGDGADLLDGGSGADLMRGGAGSDTYVVDAAGDVIEEVGGGIDTVRATLHSYTLGTGLETLVMLEGAVAGTGNDLANTIIGNGAGNVISGAGGADFLAGGGGSDAVRGGAGNDTLVGGYGNDFLDGGTGADALSGGNGNDTYVIDDVGDTITETGVGDLDTVRAWVSFSLLGAPLERLELQGGGAINGTGNSLDNWIIGNSAGNALNGGGGKDSLTGGGGADVFVFSSTGDIGHGNATRDVIFDFNQVQADRINLVALDANTGQSGDQAFTFIGNGGFTGAAGQLRAASDGPNTLVEGDVNGDGTGDFQLILLGGYTLTAGDFFL